MSRTAGSEGAHEFESNYWEESAHRFHKFSLSKNMVAQEKPRPTCISMEVAEDQIRHRNRESHISHTRSKRDRRRSAAFAGCVLIAGGSGGLTLNPLKPVPH